MKIDGECLIELIGSCRNKVQVYRSVRMPQLHTSLHFHLTPIVMINGSSRRDLLLNSQNFCRSIPAGAENPSLSRLCYRRLWGSRNRRALILGWAYYLDAFSSYPLRTWLPSVYRGHDNCPTLGTYYSPRWRRADIEVPNLPVDSSSLLPLHSRANLRLARGNLCTPPLPFGRPTPHRNCLPETVPWPVVRIFTDMSISPSLSPRQCPDRYAFRAGRNLPDKEFRYLRTVIVTAARSVHRGFGRRLPCHQSPGPGHCDPLCEEAPLLPKLRGYFAEFLRESCLAPLGILYLPTCVGFGYRYPFVEGRSSFSWEYGMGYFSAVAPGTRTLARGIFSTPSYPEKAGAPCALTHPPWTNLAEEPLGFRGIGFSPMFALLKPTFSLPLRPPPLSRVLPSKAERSPTDAFLHPTASADRLAPFIFGARALDHGHLGALAGDPGCFPLDDEAYPPSSHWPTLTPVILRSYLVFRVCLDLVPLSRPAPKQCFTPRCPVNCCASTHFGENQLALGSSGISPLTTTHPLILQHQSARGQSPGLLPLLGSLRFHVLFHSPMGVLFTLPSRYYFTIGHPGVFSLTSTPLLRLAARRLYCSPTTPFSRFRLLPFRSPLLRESLLLSFPLATKMFQFARLSLACPWIQQQFERLTYSGISGSTLIFNSPKHFVAYYALPRLWVPRIQLQENQERKAPPLSARLFGLKNAGFYGRSATPGCRRRPWGDLVVPTGWRRWGRPMDFPSFCRISLKGLKGDSASSLVSNQNTQQALALPEKEVIQPHLPVRLPCYDFTPVTSPAFGIPLLVVKVTTSGMASSHSVTGGLRSLRDLTQHLTARADDSHAPPVSAFPKAPLSFKRIRGMSSPGGILNALATALHGSIRTAPSIHRLRLGLLGYLIPFAPLAFVSQCQCRPSRVLSPLVFFPISTHFTAPPEIPSAPTVLQLDALRPIIPDNACILCITAAAGTELADAYSPDTVIASSPGKEVHDPSLGRVSVPVWLIILSDQLLIIALPFPAVVPLPRAGSYALLTRPPLETPLPVRLACVKHAASVHPEPGSNSP
uniref:Uncharacterized protein n=1 Tax=Fagus sylvatica TaxID=28930 RepID=A0A2N9I5R1_FAGSY